MTEAVETPIGRILDASAVLALLQDEPGAAAVEACLPCAGICAVNLSEVVGKLIDTGMPPEEVRAVVEPLGLTIIPFDEQLAWQTATLRPATRRAGLSLADRACLATGVVCQCPVMGADNVWAELDLPVPVELIR